MSEASIASTDSSNSSVRGLASFGERMALVMHKWTWQHLFKTTAQKRSERPPHCQGRRRGGGKPVKYATSRASSSKKVHYADFEASQIQWFSLLLQCTYLSAGPLAATFLFQFFFFNGSSIFFCRLTLPLAAVSLLLLLPSFQCLSSLLEKTLVEACSPSLELEASSSLYFKREVKFYFCQRLKRKRELVEGETLSNMDAHFPVWATWPLLWFPYTLW